jgi:hypothetical protein
LESHFQISFYTSFEADCGEVLFEANRIFRVISREKITRIFKKMKTRKATGPDGINAELLK